MQIYLDSNYVTWDGTNETISRCIDSLVNHSQEAKLPSNTVNREDKPQPMTRYQWVSAARLTYLDAYIATDVCLINSVWHQNERWTCIEHRGLKQVFMCVFVTWAKTWDAFDVFHHDQVSTQAMKYDFCCIVWLLNPSTAKCLLWYWYLNCGLR